MKNELKLISMSEIQTEEVKWLWYPYIPLGWLVIPAVLLGLLVLRYSWAALWSGLGTLFL